MKRCRPRRGGCWIRLTFVVVVFPACPLGGNPLVLLVGTEHLPPFTPFGMLTFFTEREESTTQSSISEQLREEYEAFRTKSMK